MTKHGFSCVLTLSGLPDAAYDGIHTLLSPFSTSSRDTLDGANAMTWRATLPNDTTLEVPLPMNQRLSFDVVDAGLRVGVPSMAALMLRWTAQGASASIPPETAGPRRAMRYFLVARGQSYRASGPARLAFRIQAE